jgi:two-component system sensor histidine kinase and response regulator WspE
MSDDLGDFSMLELFHLEVDNQATILNDGLLALEQDARSEKQLEALMRAAHSIKGAARMVDIETGVRLAHAMEDCFVKAQQGELQLQPHQIDLLLKAVDQLIAISTQQADAEELSVLTRQIETIERLEAVEDKDRPQAVAPVQSIVSEVMESSADNPASIEAQPELAQEDAEPAMAPKILRPVKLPCAYPRKV